MYVLADLEQLNIRKTLTIQLTTSEAGLPVIGFGAPPVLFKLLVEFIEELSFLPLREIVKCKGSCPSRLIISGSIRLRALINQLQTYKIHSI